jgi:general secretion pathway protein L
MATSFEKTLKSAQMRFARPLAEFFRWWGGELLGCLPTGLRTRLSAPPAVVMLASDGSGWSAARVRGSKIEAQQAIELSDPANLRRVLGRLETLNDQPAERRVLCLRAEQVLRKRLTLPLAAEENVAQVLGFEMDRQTPFKADQIYFDWSIAKRDPQQRQIVLDLTLVQKSVLDAALAQMQSANIDFDAVDALQQRDTLQFDKTWAVNLLPAQKRRAGVDPTASVRWILAAALIALVGLVMWQSLQARRSALAALTERTANVQAQALKTAELAKEVRQAIAGANFLVERKQTHPETIKVLLELTELIPNDTYLERVSFVGKSIQVMGQSRSADKLIALLQQAKFMQNPQFQGVIQPDPQSGRERFNLQVDLKEQVVAELAQTQQAPTVAPAMPPGAAPNVGGK